MNIPAALGVAMMMTAAAVHLLEPQPVAQAVQPLLAESVPSEFGDWKEVSTGAEQIDPARSAEAATAVAANTPSMDKPYDDVLMRAYGNSKGEVVLLTLAYGRNQRQEVKIHRPDVCYTAQGFQLVSRKPVSFGVEGQNGKPVQGMRMLVTAPGRTEAISYWIRIGQVYSDDAWVIRYHIFEQGVAGRIVDGMLVRASQIVAAPGAVSSTRYELQERFLSDLVRAVPATVRRQLLG